MRKPLWNVLSGFFFLNVYLSFWAVMDGFWRCAPFCVANCNVKRNHCAKTHFPGTFPQSQIFLNRFPYSWIVRWMTLLIDFVKLKFGDWSIYWSIDCLFVRLFDWLIHVVSGCLIVPSIDRSIDWLIDWLIDWRPSFSVDTSKMAHILRRSTFGPHTRATGHWSDRETAKIRWLRWPATRPSTTNPWAV